MLCRDQSGRRKRIVDRRRWTGLSRQWVQADEGDRFRATLRSRGWRTTGSV